MKSYGLGQLRGAWGAGFAAAEKKIQANSTLVGRHFHILSSGRIDKQGKVLAEHAPGKYEIQLFSWIMGEPTDRKIVLIEEMDEWIFYERREEWLAAGDNAALTEPSP